MSDLAPLGHNLPPSPIDDAMVPFDAAREMAEMWLDGQPVINEGQMKEVDGLIKDMKAARKAVDEARDVETKPLHEAWKGAIALWKPTQDDLDRIVKGLVGLVDGFKRKLAAEKEATRLQAEAEAWEKTRAAREATRLADATDIEATRAAAQAMEDAEAAQRAAMAAGKDTVKGLRTYTDYVVLDGGELAAWVWQNDRTALEAWLAEYATKHKLNLPGIVEVRTEKRAV